MASKLTNAKLQVIKGIFERTMIDIEMYLNDPSIDTFLLIDAIDFCVAFEVFSRGTRGRINKMDICRGCPFYIETNHPKWARQSYCEVSGRRSGSRPYYKEHEGEICLALVRFSEECKMFLQEVEGRLKSNEHEGVSL